MAENIIDLAKLSPRQQVYGDRVVGYDKDNNVVILDPYPDVDDVATREFVEDSITDIREHVNDVVEYVADAIDRIDSRINEVSSSLDDKVSISTEEEITGKKTFTNGLTADVIAPSAIEGSSIGSQSLRYQNVYGQYGNFNRGLTVNSYPVATEHTLESYLPLEGTNQYPIRNDLYVNGGLYLGGNIELQNNQSLLGKTLEGVDVNLAECSRFSDDNSPIVDLGSSNAHLNTNSIGRPTCQLNGESGESAHQYAFLNEGVTFLESKYFTPVGVAGELQLQGITFEEIQQKYSLYDSGAKSITTNTTGYISASIDSFVVDDDIITFQYRFAIGNYDTGTVTVYRALITGTDANVLARVNVLFEYQLPSSSSEYIQFMKPYSNASTIDIPIFDSGLGLRITYLTLTTCNISIYAVSSSTYINNVYRTSVYNGTPKGQVFRVQLISPSSPLVVDDTVYTEFNDEVTIRVQVTGAVYRIDKLLIGNNYAIGEISKITG